LPAAQDAQLAESEASSSEEALPAAQDTHELAPVDSWYVPAAHEVQAVAPPLLYVPASQSSQDSASPLAA